MLSHSPAQARDGAQLGSAGLLVSAARLAVGGVCLPLLIQTLHAPKHLRLKHEIRIYPRRELEAQGALATEWKLWLLLLLQVEMLPLGLLLICLLRKELLGR